MLPTPSLTLFPHDGFKEWMHVLDIDQVEPNTTFLLVLFLSWGRGLRSPPKFYLVYSVGLDMPKSKMKNCL